MTAPAASARTRRLDAIGTSLWVLAWLVVSVMVARDPERRSVTPVFHLASERWAARHDLYSDPRGYHYLPQFALLFAPFHALPVPSGDVLWRGLSILTVLAGLAALARRGRPSDPGRAYFVAALLALAPCLGAVRNGQTNLAFGGICLLLAAALSAGRWNAAALGIVLLVALKPLGLVLALLAPWPYPKLRLPLFVGLAVLATLPFFAAPPAYAMAQYRSAAAHLAGWSGTTENRFADLTALLRAGGFSLSPRGSLALRAAAGVATLALWLRAAARTREPFRALTLVLLATVYLMLFNPMTEKNSYAIVAPALALAAAVLLAAGPTRRAGLFLAAVLVSVGVLPELLWRATRDFGLWWDPLSLAAVAIFFTVAIVRRGTVFPSGGAAAP